MRKMPHLLEESKREFWIKVISLVILLLTGTLIQMMDSKINDYYLNIISDQNGIIYRTGLAQEDYLIAMNTNLNPDLSIILIGSNYSRPLDDKERFDKWNEHIEEYLAHKSKSNQGIIDIKKKMENPPKCYGVNCLNLKTIVYFVHFSSIAILLLLLIYKDRR